MKRIICVAAVARNGVIGDGPRIPWQVPGEQRLFKEVTWGHILVMGRTTYESIGRPLPGRTTIVLSRDAAWSPGHDDVVVARSLDIFLTTPLFIIGETSLFVRHNLLRKENQLDGKIGRAHV